MQYYINNIKKELEDLAYLKRERAVLGMPEAFQHIFLILPSLVHYHHPNLPGYTQEAPPTGIFNYQETDEITALLEHLFQFNVNTLDAPPSEAEISALYSMGSTCSIGQSVESDLDIWICLESSLSEDHNRALQKKCRLIEKWAKNLNIKLTLFIVRVDRFIENHHDCLMGDNCGSAQHMLLLEEFYRSANLLSGKLLLWFAVPSDFTINGKTYSSYNECVDALIEKKVINREDWIDFGSLIRLSAQEYFGASLWQLYKSIDSPFKAVLKTLLLEAYSSIYPENHSIADDMKMCLHTGMLKNSHLDSYYMLLDRVTTYLIEINDFERLALLRSCFYLKVNEKLSLPSPSPSWRRKVLSDLVKSWKWDEKFIKKLDSYQTWKIEQVREIHELLLRTMMTGYRKLLNFGRRNNLDALISPQDLTVLTRKLYAEFEVLPSKITTLNLNISDNLAEESLTFIHVQEDRVNRSGWYIYNQKPSFKHIVGHQHLEYSKHLAKLVGWCYFNGLISDSTTIFCYSNAKHDNSKIKQLIRDLQAYFPKTVPPASEALLSGLSEIRHLAIMLNIENDPTFQDVFEYDVTNDILNYGIDEMSLIGSIDLLYRNSWNEIRILHFTGDRCILEALESLLNSMHKDANSPDSIEVFCYSQFLHDDIKGQIKDLVDDCIQLRLSTTQGNLTQVKPLRINGASWYLFFERLGVSFHQFENTIDFYGAVSNNKVQGRALNMLDDSHALPKEIDSVASEGIIQFFFEDTRTGFDLYILNENNQVEIYYNCNGNKDNMVKDINNFYTSSDDRFTFSTSNSVNFNLPQFYQISNDHSGKKEIFPLN